MHKMQTMNEFPYHMSLIFFDNDRIHKFSGWDDFDCRYYRYLLLVTKLYDKKVKLFFVFYIWFSFSKSK